MKKTFPNQATGKETLAQPLLSLIVIAYDIARELPRTLYTLSSCYQKGIDPSHYEILVVDNGSPQPIDAQMLAQVEAWPGQIRLLRIESASSSPVNAINTGIAAAKGDCIGVMIDGARMCTPGLLHGALQATQAVKGSVVGALGWYLGRDFQRQSMVRGYNQAQEDSLLETVDWQQDGYLLYNIACMDESSLDGWFAPIAELNAIFMARHRWQTLGGYEPRFNMPGGGLANLDLFKRALESEGAQLVLLTSEATFHQFHGGTATNSLQKKALSDWERWHSQYKEIRGVEYELPKLHQPAILFGEVHPAIRLHYLRALAFPAVSRMQDVPPLGAGFVMASWAMPSHVWDVDVSGREAISSHQYRSLVNLLRHALRQGRYSDMVAASRWLCKHFPKWDAPSHLLSLLAPWQPHIHISEEDNDLVQDVQRIVQSEVAGTNFQFSKKIDTLLSDDSYAKEKKYFAPQPPLKIKDMSSKDFDSILLHPAIFMEPYHFTHPAPWAGHIPFAAWLIAVQQPRNFVELGTYSGISYLAFCQAIQAQKISTRAWAVDTWEGDAHAGHYSETVYNTIRAAHDPHYTSFSTLLRMTFDSALDFFENGSVDLLHIDGLHTYEAVKHDFETWLPKMSERGVVIFHDTHVYRDDFGVHRLWKELSQKYPSLHFTHSHGLGVLLVGKIQPEALLKICDPEQVQLRSTAQLMFSSLGHRFEQKAANMVTNIQLKDAKEKEAHLEEAGQRRHEWIIKLDNDIIELNNRVVELNSENEGQKKSLVEMQRSLMDARNELQAVYMSRSWRGTALLRYLGDVARKLGAKKIIAGFRRAKNAARYLVRGDFRGFQKRIMQINADRKGLKNISRRYKEVNNVGILTTNHTRFVAEIIKISMEKAGFSVEIIDDSEKSFDHDLYFVICPQMFKNLPPGEKRIAFQMEQGVSSRWFTKEYVEDLNQSLAVFDYAQSNLPFLKNKGLAYPHLYFLPVGGFRDYREYLISKGEPLSSEIKKEFDIIFYGDVNSPRRKKIIDSLKQNFKIRIESNLFGEELHQALLSAKLVVNIHYYEGALLETTRIYECLSLGVPVVTESSADIGMHAALLESGAVTVTPVDDVQAMIAAIRKELTLMDAQPNLKAHQCQVAVQNSATYFDFMLYRALFGLFFIPYERFEKLTQTHRIPGNRWVLGMPETYERRQLYLAGTKGRMPEAEIFDGIRRTPGWSGCALSYQYMAQKALQQQLKTVEISEDDVLLPENYESRREVIGAWLKKHSESWDVFLGLIARIHPETRILDVYKYEGETLVIIDRMISTVHNIYSERALQALAQWDINNMDGETNTIDVHMQRQSNLRVCVALPFLVGHAEEVSSSLWGFENGQYKNMILTAQEQLMSMVQSYEGHSKYAS